MIFSDHTACSLSRKGFLGAALLAVLAVPCWSLGQDKPAEEKPAEQKPAEDAAAQVNLTAKAGPQRTIRIHENRVYIADGNEKTITALDGSSGKIVWQTKTDGWNGEADLVFKGDELHVGRRDGFIYRKLLTLDKNTGKYLAAEAPPDETPPDPKADSTRPSKTHAEAQQALEAHVKAAELKLRRAREALEHSERLLRKGYATQLARDASAFAVEQAELDLAKIAKAGSPPVEYADAAGKVQIAALRGRESRSGLSGLVELGTAYIEAVGERDLARGRLSGLNELKARDAVSPHEVSEAEQRLVIAQRKIELLTMIIDAAGSAAETELEVLRQQFEAVPHGTAAAVAEAEMRLKILKSIK